jgi:hypothetical protein
VSGGDALGFHSSIPEKPTHAPDRHLMPSMTLSIAGAPRLFGAWAVAALQRAAVMVPIPSSFGDNWSGNASYFLTSSGENRAHSN